jgi:hypothetical protein
MPDAAILGDICAIFDTIDHAFLRERALVGSWFAHAVLGVPHTAIPMFLLDGGLAARPWCAAVVREARRGTWMLACDDSG